MSKDEATTQNTVAKDANKRSAARETHPIEAMPNAYGEVADIDKSKYPEGSAAAKGTATPPSGQGGETPKSRPDYQDQFPPNPEPSESAKAWADKIREVGAVQAHSDAIAEESGRSSKAK
jgi:hypothetical protein